MILRTESAELNSAKFHIFKNLLVQSQHNVSTRTMCEICSKLTNRNQSIAIGVVLMSLLLTLNRSHTCSGVSIVDFEPVNTDWVISEKLKTEIKGFNQHSLKFSFNFLTAYSEILVF